MKTTCVGFFPCCETVYRSRVYLPEDHDHAVIIIKEQYRVFDLMHLQDHPECPAADNAT